MVLMSIAQMIAYPVSRNLVTFRNQEYSYSWIMKNPSKSQQYHRQKYVI